MAKQATRSSTGHRPVALFRGLAARIVATAFGALFAVNAYCQDWIEPPRKYLDPLGVDMSEVNIPRDDTFLTIGNPSADGLSWTYHAHFQGLIGDFRIAVGTPCSGPPPIFSDPSCDGSLTYILFGIGESATTFEPTGPTTFDNWSGTASTLSLAGGIYTYTEGDGTVYTTGANGLATIVHPNGVKVTISYTSSVATSAVTNTGFAFKFPATGGNNGSIYAVNMSAHSCATIASCAASDSQITNLGNPEVQIGPDATVLSNFEITDPAGQKWEYRGFAKFNYEDLGTHEIIHGPRTLWAFQDPTGYWFRTTRAIRGGLTSFSDPRGTFVYSGQAPYDDPDSSYAGTTKDPSGAVVYTAEMNSTRGLGMDYEDGLGRQTTYAVTEDNHGISTFTSLPIAPWSRLSSITYPEGDYVTYAYDARGNITSAVKTGKWGSGLSESVTSSYPSTCTNPVTCNKPTWTRDAKGNETDYTYDSTHGGVLTATSPIDANSLRKKTFNTYTSYNTGDGLIYRLTRSETCGLTATQLSTLTACPATAATSVTTTTYFGKTFQPLTVTQTDGASSVSATTTYTYDYVGNVTIIDGPRTDVDDRTYKTYDANRRVIYEAGVLPSGLQRTVVHHVYDAAGRELRTDTGYENDATTDGSDFVTPTTVNFDINGDSITDSLTYGNSNNAGAGAHFVVSSFKRMTLDAAGRVVKTEQVQP